MIPPVSLLVNVRERVCLEDLSGSQFWDERRWQRVASTFIILTDYAVLCSVHSNRRWNGEGFTLLCFVSLHMTHITQAAYHSRGKLTLYSNVIRLMSSTACAWANWVARCLMFLNGSISQREGMTHLMKECLSNYLPTFHLAESGGLFTEWIKS